MQSNIFAMKGWHREHAEKVIIRCVRGISSDASSFERRNYKKYNTASSCTKQIEYDIRHGVTKSEVMMIFSKIRHNKAYADVRSNPETMMRLDELEQVISGAGRLKTTWE